MELVKSTVFEFDSIDGDLIMCIFSLMPEQNTLLQK